MAAGPILICFDESEESSRAIAAAAALLKGRAAIVLTIGSLEYVAETYAAAGSGAADTLLAVKERASAQAEAGAAQARKAGLKAEARAEVESPTWRGIVEVADEIDACVIVVGTEQFGRLRELAEGSVSHGVTTHAHRPVLVVPRAYALPIT
jgi:nucleotide-binding universal stress UspA family protein